MKIEVISEMWCNYCTKAKSLLRENGIEFEELSIIDGIDLMEKNNLSTIPQIFIDGELVEGGYQGLVEIIPTLK